MIARIVCLIRGHRCRPARDGVSAHDLPDGGSAFSVHTIECQRCHQRRYAPSSSVPSSGGTP